MFDISTIHLPSGERVLETPSNPISIGVTLQRLSRSSESAAAAAGGASFLGSMLFNRSDRVHVSSHAT